MTDVDVRVLYYVLIKDSLMIIITVSDVRHVCLLHYEEGSGG